MDTNELIENKFFELKKYIDECFEEQSKDNKKFMNNVLDLVKLNITEAGKENNSKLETTIIKLENASKLNDVVSNKMLDTLKDIDNLYKSYEDDSEDIKNSKIIYDNMKKGIKQFTIQLLIVIAILLIILGSYQLICWII